MDTLKNKSMRCVVKMNNIRHFTLFTFGFFVGCNRVMSSFSVLWVYPFSILCRWRHYANILQWMACFLEAISKQLQCSEDASKVKERLAHIWISSSQLTTSLCQFGRHAKVGSTFHRRLSGRNLPPSSPFFILLFLRTVRTDQFNAAFQPPLAKRITVGPLIRYDADRILPRPTTTIHLIPFPPLVFPRL